MNEPKATRGPGRMRLWLSLALLLVITVLVLLLGRANPATWTSVFAASAVGAGGVLAMAALLAPVAPHARWAHWTSAAIIAGWVLAGAAFAESPAAWAGGQREYVWFMPWFVLTTGTSSGRAARGRCATRGRLGDWTLVGASAIFPPIFLVADWLGRRI